ncbi:MAG: hypothetical protein HWN65_08820 [Candidatus Helarchaeota archaeon]|nr:hypothetical protein [Candidatus Helarchaeota archaeon]
MVYLFVHSTYPISKAKDVGKKYLEVVKKYPPDRSLGKEVIQAAVRASPKGISVIGVSEVKKGKYTEALIRIGKTMQMYADIDGFNYSVVTRVNLVEAMGIIDMTPPET